MHPHLITLGPITIKTYGTMIVLGFLSGVWLAKRRAAREGISPQFVSDLSFWLLLSGLAGAKLLYIAVSWRQVWSGLQRGLEEPRELVTVLGAGFVFYGGLFAACLVAIWYIRRAQQPLWTVFDVMSPSVMLGLGLGRIGCTSAGCCYGRAYDGLGAITFNHPDCIAPLGQSLYPTQPLMFLMCVGLAMALHWWTPRRRVPGQVFWLMVAGYSIGRFGIECLRGDPRGQVPWIGLSTSQFIGLIALAASALALIRLSRHRPPVEP